MQIVRGFVAPFRGALFVARHALWGFILLPLLLDLGAAIGAGYWGGGRLGDWVGSKLDAGWFASTVSVSVGFIVAVLTFILLQPVFSAPFNDLLCERTEKIRLGRAPSTGLLRSVWMAITHGVLKMILYAFALALTLVAGSLTGWGGFLGAVLYAVFVAYDAFDYPLARRAVSFSGKWRYLLSRPGQTLGYCCGAGLFYFVPLAGLLVPSFAAVGATLLYVDNSADDAVNNEGNRGTPVDRAGARMMPGERVPRLGTTEKGEMTR